MLSEYLRPHKVFTNSGTQRPQLARSVAHKDKLIITQRCEWRSGLLRKKSSERHCNTPKQFSRPHVHFLVDDPVKKTYNSGSSSGESQGNYGCGLEISVIYSFSFSATYAWNILSERTFFRYTCIPRI